MQGQGNTFYPATQGEAEQGETKVCYRVRQDEHALQKQKYVLVVQACPTA